MKIRPSFLLGAPELLHKWLGVVLFCIPFCVPVISARAAEQRLSDLSLTSCLREANDVVIDTDGAAKVRLSFVLPGVVRVRLSPTGAFPLNLSPAVVLPPGSEIAPEIRDRGDEMVVRGAGLSLHLFKHGLRLRIYEADDRTPLLPDAPDAGPSWDTETGAVRDSRPLQDGEHIYGLGEDNANGGTLDRRGTVCDLWTGQQIRSGNVTAEDPIPFYLSTGSGGHGYGVFVDNDWHMRFDVGRTRSDRISWSAPGGPIDTYIIDGPSFKTVIDRYTQLTGRPTLLPLWALGYWQSRCWFNNFEEMQQDEDRLRSDGIPLDVLVIDANWPNKHQDYQWGEAWLKSGKKPEAWLAGFRAKGVRVVQSNSGPMIRPDSENYQSGWDKRLFATDGRGNPVTCGYYDGNLMDFTNPGMTAWLWPQLKPLYEQGIAGWWLDLIEPEGEPSQTVYYAGKSADIHNSFGLRVFRTYAGMQKSAAPTSRPVILGRAGSAGVQRYGIIWTGDTHSDWATFRAHIPEAQNAGLSGLNWWTCDTGGFLSGFYKDDQYGAHAQLYERWMEFSCFSPITRAHKSGPCEPFQFGAGVEAACRKYIKLRYSLLPYIYTHAEEAHRTGVPMLRALILEYQNDPQAATAKDEFMFGPDLLVAPILQEDTTSRPVYLPTGIWIGLEDGCEYTGGTTTIAAAPYDRIPLFIRDGAILPLAPDMQHTGEKPWDPITLDIYPHGDSSATLYEDDGLTTAFESGSATRTIFHCTETPVKTVLFTIASANRLFSPRAYDARFHLTARPTLVLVDGKTIAPGAAGYRFDPKSNRLTVNVKTGSATLHEIVITLDGTLRPRPQPPISPAIVAAHLEISSTVIGKP